MTGAGLAIEDDRRQGHKGSPIPDENRWGLRVTVALLILTALLAVGLFVARYWPYNDSQIDQPSELYAGFTPEGEPIPLTDRTSDGLPVVRVGHPVFYLTSFCNKGVDITTTRWMDGYGSTLPQIDGGTLEGFERGLDVRQSAQAVSITEFFLSEERCVDDVPVNVDLGVQVTDPGYYKLRTDNVYQPNFLAPQINDSTQTELFYYAAPGAEVP